MNARAWIVALALLLASGLAGAHQQSQSFLRVDVPADTSAPVRLRLDLALVDLEHAIGLDDDADAQVQWRELRAHEADIRRYVEGRLDVAAGPATAVDPSTAANPTTPSDPCPLHFDRLRVDTHADGGYAVLEYDVRCPVAASELQLRYRLFFDIDGAHRSLVSLTRADDPPQSGVLDAASRELTFGAGKQGVADDGWRGASQWIAQGLWHIWTGYDHLLFLLTLLLPAVVRREPGVGWVSQPSLRVALADVARVVTAFTVAHSLTLGLAALGVVRFETRWVESLIAVTVLLGALNILFPVVRERRWLLALGFGLVHGLGFAAALGDLGLGGRYLVRNLLLFNLGVELGQLAIVALFVPTAFLLREQRWYRSVATPAAATAVGVLASWWLAQRML